MATFSRSNILVDELGETTRRLRSKNRNYFASYPAATQIFDRGIRRLLPSILLKALPHMKALIFTQQFGSIPDPSVFHEVLNFIPFTKLKELRMKNLRFSTADLALFASRITSPSMATLQSGLTHLDLPLLAPGSADEELETIPPFGISYTFEPSRANNAETLVIRVTADPHTRRVPTSIVNRLLQAFGTEQGFKKVSVDGVDVATSVRDAEHHVPFGLSTPKAPNTQAVSALELRNVDFDEGAFLQLYRDLDRRTVRSLSSVECENHEILFQYLIDRQSLANLESFAIENYYNNATWDKTSQNNIDELLSSFSRLRDCSIVIRNYWRLVPQKLLSRHQTLESLHLNLGGNNIDKSTLEIINSYCPDLKHLGFHNHKIFGLPLRLAQFGNRPASADVIDPNGFDDYFRSMAKALAKFPSLTTLHIMFGLPDKKPIIIKFSSKWWWSFARSIGRRNLP